MCDRHYILINKGEEWSLIAVIIVHVQTVGKVVQLYIKSH